MATMNVALPDRLKAYVDHRVADGSYQSSSEHVRELIRRDQDLHRLRDQVLRGASSPAVGALETEYFDGLRNMVRAQAEAP